MYARLRDPLLRLLRAPTEPPAAPAGSHASVAVFRASPRYPLYRLAVGALVGVAVLLGLGVGATGAAIEGATPAAIALCVVAVLVLVGLLVAAFCVQVDYELRYYVVTDRSLRVREGALVLREQTITHANIQHLEISQGPLQRLFGLSDLLVRTAGGGGGAAGSKNEGGGHVVRVAGVEDAAAIRATIREHLRGRRDGGLGDEDDPPRGAARAASPAVRALLAAIRDEAAGLRSAAEARPGVPPRPGPG